MFKTKQGIQDVFMAYFLSHGDLSCAKGETDTRAMLHILA